RDVVYQQPETRTLRPKSVSASQLGLCFSEEQLSDSARRVFQDFVDERLVGLGLFGGHASELPEKFRGDPDGNQLFCIAGDGTADSASSVQFGGARFRNIRQIDFAIRHMLCVLCASLDAR